jgi:hypothetical protein
MAKIQYSKEDLAGNVYPDGMYEVRLETFEPKKSKGGDSVNLNPVLKIVNHAALNGKRVFDNMNTGAAWIIEAIVHAFGLQLVPNGSGGGDLPGEFMGPDDNPEEWQYVGPLTGVTAKVMLKKTSYQGKDSSKVDQWFCQLPQGSCNMKHPTGLAK